MKPTKNTRYQNTFFSTVFLAVTFSGLAFSADEIDILYNGDTGPAQWSKLNPDWEACAGTGDDAIQSPINVNRAIRDRSLSPLDIQTYATSIDMFNNGHTIEQRYEGTGSAIYFDENVYELQQFHFHTLSEHTFSNIHAPLELHAVYSANDGSILVVSQMFRISHFDNRAIQSLIDAGLPVFDGEETTRVSSSINLDDLLTNTRQYFTYTGSLTTPPCSEGVTWIILKRRAPISSAQYEEFRKILGNNFRPIQALNNRVVRTTVKRRPRW